MPDLTQRVRALACNAVAPALDAYNAAHPTRTAPWWLPLSAREVVGTAVAEAVDAEIRREVAAEVERLREENAAMAELIRVFEEGARGANWRAR